MLTTILITVFATLFVIGSINFFLVYIVDVGIHGLTNKGDVFIGWTIGLGWIWYWGLNILIALPAEIYGWFRYGVAIGVKGSPAHYFVYCRNPLKFFAVRKALKNKDWYYWVKTYFPLGPKTGFKSEDYKFFFDVKRHQAKSHILYV